MKKALVFATVLAAGVPTFAFTPAMEARDVGIEVTARHKKGETLEVIAAAAKSVNIAAGVLAPEMLLTGKTADQVLVAMIKAGYYPPDAVNALVNLGADRMALNQLAIANGADPGGLLNPTAAGGTPGTFSGTPFSTSRSSTLGGGGVSSVSGS